MWRLFLCPILAYAGPLVFQAGPPELSSNPGGIAFPLTPAEYQKFTSQGLRNIIPVTRPPAKIGPNAGYGYNFVVDGKNRGWMLDGDDEHGWVLYLDMDGTGDLSAAKPEPLERVNGVPQVTKEVVSGQERWFIRFQIIRAKPQGEEKVGIAIQSAVVRRGALELDGRRMAFALTGDRGHYNRPENRVAFDRKGAGELESYKISDRYVNLFGKTYEFSVDDAGNALTLTESETDLPDRPALKPGTVAPSFATTDIAGKPQRSEDYRGRMLLVEFWSTGCAPCRAEAPKMAKFFNETARDQMAFLGISSDESETRLTDFLKEHGLSWPQIREPFSGSMHVSYRVEGEPTYFLLSPKGEIMDTWVGGGLAIDRLSKLLKHP